MKLILLYVWAEKAILGSAKTALKFKYEIEIGYNIYYWSLKSERNNLWFKLFNILMHNQLRVPQYKV